MERVQNLLLNLLGFRFLDANEALDFLTDRLYVFAV